MGKRLVELRGKADKRDGKSREAEFVEGTGEKSVAKTENVAQAVTYLLLSLQGSGWRCFLNVSHGEDEIT